MYYYIMRCVIMIGANAGYDKGGGNRMFQLLFIMLVCFLLTLAYTVTAGRFTDRKLILYIPSFIAILWFLGTLYWHITAPPEGIQGLTIYFVTLFAIATISSNVFSYMIFSARK